MPTASEYNAALTSGPKFVSRSERPAGICSMADENRTAEQLARDNIDAMLELPGWTNWRQFCWNASATKETATQGGHSMSGELPINIDHLLIRAGSRANGSSTRRDGNPQSVLHTICAFANDFHNLGGGYVVLGVEERNGKPLLPPKGLDPDAIEGIQKELLDLGNSAIRPYYHPLTATYEINGRLVLVLWAFGGETRPYKAKVSLGKTRPDWAYYIRKLSSTVRARGEDERELLGLAATVPFDDRYSQSASLDDLSHRLICEYLRDIGSDLAKDALGLSVAELGQRLNIVGGPPEALFPKNVGLLFFNDHPHKFFPATQIDVVWFPDGPGGDRFEEKEFRGPLSVISQRGNRLHRAQLPQGNRRQSSPQTPSGAVLELPHRRY